MHLLFKPIAALLDRLRYPWKFTFVGVIFLIGLVVLFGQMYTSVGREVAHTQRQIAGLELLDKVFSVLVISQQHRGYSSGFLGGDQAMGAHVSSQAEALIEGIERLDAELAARSDWAVLESRWNDIRVRLVAVIAHGLSLSAPDNFHVHTEAIELILLRIGDVGEVSGLAGNSDPRVVNLVAPMLRTVPQLTEGLGRLRGYATGSLARTNVSMQDEYILASQLAALAAGESELKDRLRRAALGNAALARSLETAAYEIEESIDRLRHLVNTEVLNRNFTVAPTEFFSTGTVAIDTVLKHYRETLRPLAEELMHEHVYTLRITMASSVLIMLTITLIAAYLFGGIYFSIQRSVHELTQGAQQFADGEFGARVSLSARDELQQVADRFNAMAQGIGELLIGQQLKITRQKALEQQLKQIAHFDALTALPNRVLFADRLTQAMARARRTELALALVYIDLDGFKAVNDAHGHAAGDRLLITVAQRMKDCLRDGDTIARLGGDEFVGVLSDLRNHASTQTLIQRMLAAIARPVQVDDLVLSVSGSVGVTFYPQRESIDADQLLRQADQAMYQAKLAGKNRSHVFDIEHNTNLRDRNELLERIREGLEKRQFELQYQPKVNMRTGEIVGAEALIRWRHPEHGLQPPSAFLPAIANHPLEIDVGRWVIDTALGQIETWLDDGLSLPVSVNIAGYHLQQADFVDELQTLLALHPRVPPHYLELEVLESSALTDIAHASRVIETCGRIGVGVALDDFGTGYSSLAYLKRLPVGVIKIDRSFVCDMLHDPDDLAILEGVLGLARSFQRGAIAEGVETVAHGQLLLQLGCELAQGFGIARPMAADDLPCWIKNWRPEPAWIDVRRVPPEMRTVLYAAVEHRGWIKRVEAYLSGAQDLPPTLPFSAQRFGQWFDPFAMQKDRHPRLTQIHALHLQAHALGAELITLFAANKADTAQTRLPVLHRLHERLLSLLDGLIQDDRQRLISESLR